ncbi:MAG: hypothetical protein GYA50_10105 [Eubacteriaceae bacterium]|nr:hypothetical protein [Eubacteriaceae bacterium]
MSDKNDWRLSDHDEFYNNLQLKHAQYKRPSESWDHDHCEFCFDKFSEYEGDLHEGYCTLDNYHWICEVCFNDFKDLFNWSVINNI